MGGLTARHLGPGGPVGVPVGAGHGFGLERQRLAEERPREKQAFSLQTLPGHSTDAQKLFTVK